MNYLESYDSVIPPFTPPPRIVLSISRRIFSDVATHTVRNAIVRVCVRAFIQVREAGYHTKERTEDQTGAGAMDGGS